MRDSHYCSHEMTVSCRVLSYFLHTSTLFAGHSLTRTCWHRVGPVVFGCVSLSDDYESGGGKTFGGFRDKRKRRREKRNTEADITVERPRNTGKKRNAEADIKVERPRNTGKMRNRDRCSCLWARKLVVGVSMP